MSKKNVVPEGTRDLILDECDIKRKIERDIDDLFYLNGYKEIITPTIEYYETFNDSLKSLEEEEMYKFFDNRGRILVLRPDMTIPIARVVMTKLKESCLPIKLRYNCNVFRVHTSLKGKQNEFTDCGIELIGLKDSQSDLEILVLALEALKKLNLKQFKLEIGNINLLKSVFSSLKIYDSDKEKIAQFIEDKNLKSLEEYLNKLNIDESYKILLNKLPWMFGGKEVLEEAKKIAFNEEIKNIILYLEKLYIGLKELGYEKNITFDFGMAPGFNYYTGIIFRGYAEGIGNEFLRGGRYDKVIKIKNLEIPAIGFSINTNAVSDLLKEDSEIKFKENRCKIYYGEENKIKAIQESLRYKEKGYIVELNPVEDKKMFKIVFEEGKE